MKKKLIIKFILFICIFWIFQYVVGLLLRDDYTTLTRTVIHYMHKAEVIETVILGDSHTYYAINPDLLTNETNVETYLCGSAAQDLDGTYALLRETHKFHPELKNVYIDIDYYIFNHSSIKSRSVLTSIWIISNYLKDIKIKMDYLFHAVPPKYYPDIFLKIGKDKFQINPKANLEATIARINGDYRNFRFSEDSKLASFSKGYLPKINESDDDNDVFINEKSLKPFSINQINSDWYNYMEKIIDYCNNNNLNLVLLSIPSDFGRFLSMGNYDEYYNYISQYFKNKNLIYYDLNLCKKEFLNFSKSDYCDDEHLSRQGAEKLSNFLVKLLNNSNYGDNLKYFYNSFSERVLDEDESIYGFNLIENEYKQSCTFIPISNKKENSIITYNYYFIKNKNERIILKSNTTDNTIEYPVKANGIIQVDCYINDKLVSKVSQNFDTRWFK